MAPSMRPPEAGRIVRRHTGDARSGDPREQRRLVDGPGEQPADRVARLTPRSERPRACGAASRRRSGRRRAHAGAAHARHADASGWRGGRRIRRSRSRSGHWRRPPAPPRRCRPTGMRSGSAPAGRAGAASPRAPTHSPGPSRPGSGRSGRSAAARGGRGRRRGSGTHAGEPGELGAPPAAAIPAAGRRTRSCRRPPSGLRRTMRSCSPERSRSHRRVRSGWSSPRSVVASPVHFDEMIADCDLARQWADARRRNAIRA